MCLYAKAPVPAIASAATPMIARAVPLAICGIRLRRLRTDRSVPRGHIIWGEDREDHGEAEPIELEDLRTLPEASGADEVAERNAGPAAVIIERVAVAHVA